MTQKQIKSWRIIFATTVAAFELSDTIGRISGGQGLDERGKQLLSLHKHGLAECEKESPDINVISSLITQMEIIAAQPIQKFPQGGISEGWGNNDFVQGATIVNNDLDPDATIIPMSEFWANATPEEAQRAREMYERIDAAQKETQKKIDEIRRRYYEE